MTDQNSKPLCRVPASEAERAAMVAAAAAIGVDGEWLLATRENSGQRVVEVPVHWMPLSDPEYATILPYLPAGVRGAKGPGPRDFLNVLLCRVAHRHTGWRGAPGIETTIQADLARQRFHRWAVGNVLDDLVAAVPRLNLDPSRRQQLEVLGRMMQEARARLAEARPPRRKD